MVAEVGSEHGLVELLGENRKHRGLAGVGLRGKLVGETENSVDIRVLGQRGRGRDGRLDDGVVDGHTMEVDVVGIDVAPGTAAVACVLLVNVGLRKFWWRDECDPLWCFHPLSSSEMANSCRVEIEGW